MQPRLQIPAIIAIVPILSLCLTVPAQALDIAPLVKTIREVGDEGKGNREASRAWRELVQADAASLPELLAALDGANPLAANWLRSAIETIAARHLGNKSPGAAQGKLPAAPLEKFVLETTHDPRGRRLAFELLTKVDPTAPDRLIPGMLNDPSVEFRRDAVVRLIDEAAGLEGAQRPIDAGRVYLKALEAARDQDQTEALVKALEKLGHHVDLPVHFGFVMDWKLIGPFDSTGNKGFNVVYPPETAVDLDAKYPGQKGEVSWTAHTTDDKYGIVDLAKAVGPHKGAAIYAYTEFTSDADRTVDLRLGTPNSWKVWVNGKPIFGREEYHRGMQVDQYQIKAPLNSGKNTILIKVCQNEQKEEWAQRYQFQLRVCDATGTAILSKTRPASNQRTASR